MADQTQQRFEKPEMLKLRIKEVVASIMESSATDRVINALNMPSSASHPDMDIYRWEALSLFASILALLTSLVASVRCRATIRLMPLSVLRMRVRLCLEIGAMVSENG